MRDGGRVKVVKQRTDHDVRGRFARGHSFVESHRERAFVGVDVSVEDHTDVELHQQLLHGSTHGDRVELVLVRGIGVVPVVREHSRIQVKIDSNHVKSMQQQPTASKQMPTVGRPRLYTMVITISKRGSE